MNYDRGSIRNNLEIFGDDSEDEGEMTRRRTSPGPGAYQTLSSSFMGRETVRPSSIQVFGSTVSRFTQKPIGTKLGPGQYRPRVAGKKFNSALAVAGSAAFKVKSRPGIIDEAKSYEKPAPGEYNK